MTIAKNSGPIVLLTDFGLQDAFVGILKGVILSINPHANIVDLSHGVRPQDILQGAFLLLTAQGYFPLGTIFCVVVDPGVGEDRRPVLIQTKEYCFVGPDNGVLWQAVQKNGIESVVHLNQSVYFLENISFSFHGRDIFAPIAAHLSLGRETDKLGSIVTDPVNDLVHLDLPVPENQGDSLVLTILYIDIYGNMTLNITWDEFKAFVGKGFCLLAGTTQITMCYKAYAQARDNEPFIMAASAGYMEVAVKNGNAAEQLGMNSLDRMVLTRPIHIV